MQTTLKSTRPYRSRATAAEDAVKSKMDQNGPISLKKPNKIRNVDKSTFPCNVCSAVLKSEVYYQKHMKARHPKKRVPFVCDYCGREFELKDYLRVHCDRHRKHQIFTCSTCQKSYISKHTFRRHLKLHIEKHVCDICNRSFSSKINLANHHASSHSEDLPFNCDFCTRHFASKTARNNHHYSAHKDKESELKFKCEECNIFFEMKEELRIHSFIHFHGEIKTCLECNQIFKTNRLLKIHMLKHEAKKSFQCTECGDLFTFKQTLAKHIRLNRCKGPNTSQGEPKEEEKVSIALSQLNEINRPRKMVKNSAKNLIKKEIKTTKVPVQVTEKETILKAEQEPQELVCNKMENFEDTYRPSLSSSDEETNCTRKLRKRISDLHSIKSKTGRSHETYICDFCGEAVKFLKGIRVHLRKHVGQQTYNCSECQISCRSRTALVKHLLEVHGVKKSVLLEKFSCDFCDKKFDMKSRLESHKLSHDETARKIVCDICGAAFKTVGNLTRHEKTHVTSRDFLCSYCMKTFKTEITLKEHVTNVHAEVRVFVNCPECKAIIQEKNLQLHIRNKHTEKGLEKSYQCTVCFNTFKTQKLAERHFEAVHNPTFAGKLYQCSECPEQFYRQRHLKEHSFLHFEGNVYQCQVCSKMFKSKRLLQVHQVTHNEESAKFPCAVCSAVFKTRSGRQKHMKLNCGGN